MTKTTTKIDDHDDDDNNNNNKEIEKEIEILRVSDDDLQYEEVVRVVISSKNNESKGFAATTTTTTTTVSGTKHKNLNCTVDDDDDDDVNINNKKEFRFIPLRMGGSHGRTHLPSDDTISMMKNDEITLNDLKAMTEKFYELAFMDHTLDKLIRSRTDPHGDRFAKWIHQKLCDSHVWDDDRIHRDKTPVRVSEHRTVVVEDRTSAHVSAWYSPKRPSNDVGKRFKLDDCRVWMRLHFYALRQSGLMLKSPTFANYYVRFIGHFIRVYESTAPIFARDSFRWSANPDNVREYIRRGRKMDDVLGLTLEKAILQLPKSEAEEYMDWPYNYTEVPLEAY